MPTARGREALTYIAANVRRARARLGMTQERLAEAAELDLRFLQRVERGTANPSAVTLVALADALGVTPGALFKKAALPEVRRGRPPASTRSR
jgi:transcriptional regulator with XRE-family HTH domain